MNRKALLAVAAVVAVAAVAGLAWWAQQEPAGDSPSPADERAIELEQARQAVQAQPNDPQVRLRLVRALRRRNQFQSAEAELLKVIQRLPEPQAQREVVLLRAPQDWPEDMAWLFQKVVRDHPDDPEVLLAVADSYSAKGLWAGAEPLYTRLIEKKPDDTELYFKRGVARMREAYYRTAAEDFRKALAAHPGRYEARLFLGNSLLGDARMAEAERELTACRKQRPGAAEPLIGLAACAVERNDLAAAEALLLDAAARAGDSPLVLHDLGALYLRQGRTEPAIAILKRLVELVPDHRQGHFLLSQAYLAAGNSAESQKHEAIYQELDRKEEQRLAARRGMR
jgi:tetratricopeptide (TPR) repeat protein